MKKLHIVAVLLAVVMGGASAFAGIDQLTILVAVRV
jgi:hypothetical protein